MILKSESRLNNAVPKATGMITTFCTSIPIALPSSAITPATRHLRSPILIHSPSATSSPKSSALISLPIAQTGGEYLKVTPGKKLPDSISHPRMLENTGVVPIIDADRSKPSY